MNVSASVRNAIRSGLVATMFMLGIGVASAGGPEVIFDADGNAIAILNLPVTDEQTLDTTIYDVDFVFDEVGAVYPPDGVDLDFDFPNDEDILVALGAVNIALNDANPRPVRVGTDDFGSQSSRQFFLGYSIEDDAFVASIGGEYFVVPNPPIRNDPNVWDPCDRKEQSPEGEAEEECIEGVGTIGLGEKVVWAKFTELGAQEPQPEISLMPTSLTPATLLGEDVEDQQFSVTNSSSGTLEYTITEVQPWLSVSPASGTSEGEMNVITVSYDTAGLDLGVYTATITVSDTNASNDPQTVEVTLFVTELPAIGLSATMIMTETTVGNDALSDTFKVANVGGLFLVYDVSVDKVGVTLDPDSGVSFIAPDTITVSYDTKDLVEGVYHATITVSDPAAVNNPQTISLVVTITGVGPLGTTEARQTPEVNTIPGLQFGLAGTYMKSGFPLVLPQSAIDTDTVFHDGGSFTFSSSQTANTYTYGDWVFDVSGTCAADADPCFVQTDNGTPWALRNVDFLTRTARMVFTDDGAQAFSDLAGSAGPVQVFASSQRFKGDLGGLAGADTLCTNAAAAAGLEGDWRAWLSDSSTDARDRIPDGEYQRLDGTVVAANLADLTDGTLNAPIDQDENGSSFAGNPWTGTQPDGTVAADTCNDWVDDTDASDGVQGQFPSTTGTWTQLGSTADCDFQRALYCFSGPAFLAEDTFAKVSFIPEPRVSALAAVAIATLGLVRQGARRRRGSA